MTPLRRFYRRPQKLVLRRFNFQIHLWAGIVLAVYLVVIGLTGSVLVFRAELEPLSCVKPWRAIRAEEPYADLAVVVDNLKAAYPNHRISSVMAPTGSRPVFLAVLEGRRRITVASDPAEGRVLGELSNQPRWLDVIRDLHVSLLLGRTGRLLNGAGALALLVLNLTGLVIWWPGVRTWRRALKVDFRRRWRRINFDLHSAVGFWTLGIVSLWAISGIYFSRVITARPPAITVTPGESTREIDLSSLVARARLVDPGTKLGGILFPYGRRAPLGVLMHRRSSPGREYDDTVYFNPYTTAYITTWRYGVNQSVGDWLIWSQVPLHYGTSWGISVKLLWAAAGLAIPLLTVTGCV